MAYPPDEHALRDLEITSWLEALDHGFAELTITEASRDASGAVSLGALVTLVDLVCARVTFAAAAPHWIATADLSVTTAARPHEGVVVAEARVARAGSKLIAVDIDLGDVGVATGSFVRIPREASVSDGQFRAIGERTRLERTGPALTVPLSERMGLRVDDGVAELDRTDYVSNSFGTINGGVLGYTVVAAAESATGWPAADVTLRYLGQTKVGPARATATIVRRAPDHAVADVSVRDAGADGALLVRGLVTTTH